jgi:hypothetical protein
MLRIFDVLVGIILMERFLIIFTIFLAFQRNSFARFHSMIQVAVYGAYYSRVLRTGYLFVIFRGKVQVLCPCLKGVLKGYLYDLCPPQPVCSRTPIILFVGFWHHMGISIL